MRLLEEVKHELRAQARNTGKNKIITKMKVKSADVQRKTDIAKAH